MKDLESNGEIFGSGKGYCIFNFKIKLKKIGVGKWNEEWKKNEHIEMKKFIFLIIHSNFNDLIFL